MKQLLRNVVTAEGVSAGNASHDGSRWSTADSVSDTSSPSKARLPVSIS
jgi:hypothetical protein